MIVETLAGHISPETAYVVPDYPYGFRLRCQIRYWVETNKRGQRVVSQTSNPKKEGLVWNKPKASTYANIRVLYLDEQGYVQNAILTYYADAQTIAQFQAEHAAGLQSVRDQKELTFLVAVATVARAHSRSGE